ncbi:diaminobutyrate--2-oxoglutarate transaminase [Plantactinospora sp. KBS50]|uniref:diaminobutyrate--2-oxoglutarate transaminase n=1 Tax=Plantactinospora sp. KBS50 TaxID=2024580 RepID=UPI000BAAE463|nr:diaminobutyrate--2-oxoglutarate transaminase [Plantactinospora sp. KBS50]ASW57541.1 diaminobutyrate--2-oxoglutarate transaminase [Plantactinospora sp. KBS50]
MSIFDQYESGVRSYSRNWPAVFDRARGSRLYTADGTSYLDFFAGAGTLNYGHNDPVLKRALIDYLERDGVTHALDMFTTARADLLRTLSERVLAPRDLDYRVAFPGPAGATAVEAALKLARKVTGRTHVGYFDDGFHGMTLGALSVNGFAANRDSAGVPLGHGVRLPYDAHPDLPAAEIPDFDRLLDRTGERAEPAAVIVETVQGEGGMTAVRAAWLRALAQACQRHGVLLIVDDIQMGCGRTGPFFSFEDAGIVPDLVCLSKAIGGYGSPLALLLIRPELDIWQPGEHNGTFRGFNHAFVTATEALRAYWSDDTLEKSTRARGERVGRALQDIAASYPEADLAVRGRGLGRGLRFGDPAQAGRVRAAAFERHLLMETSGRHDDVVKLLPPLTITDADLDEGLSILESSVRAVLGGGPR